MSIKISGWSMSRILYVNWMEFWMQDRHRYFLRGDMWWLLHTCWSTNATQNYKKCTITSPTVALETNQNRKIWIKNIQEPTLENIWSPSVSNEPQLSFAMAAIQLAVAEIHLNTWANCLFRATGISKGQTLSMIGHTYLNPPANQCIVFFRSLLTSSNQTD